MVLTWHALFAMTDFATILKRSRAVLYLSLLLLVGRSFVVSSVLKPLTKHTAVKEEPTCLFEAWGTLVRRPYPSRASLWAEIGALSATECQINV